MLQTSVTQRGSGKASIDENFSEDGGNSVGAQRNWGISYIYKTPLSSDSTGNSSVAYQLAVLLVGVWRLGMIPYRGQHTEAPRAKAG